MSFMAHHVAALRAMAGQDQWRAPDDQPDAPATQCGDTAEFRGFRPSQKFTHDLLTRLAKLAGLPRSVRELFALLVILGDFDNKCLRVLEIGRQYTPRADGRIAA